MAFSNVRIPPDSTGKRLLTHKTLELSYNSGITDFSIDDHVYGKTTGASGTVSRVNGTTSSGIIFLVLDDESPAFEAGEELEVGAVTYAYAVNAGTEGHVQKMVLTGSNNQYYEQFIDVKGAAYTRFADGSPSFNPFGAQRVSQTNTVGK